MRLNIRSVSVALLLCLAGSCSWAQAAGQKQTNPAPESQKQTKAPQVPQQQAQQKQAAQPDEPKQMKGLDEEVQEIKSDVLRIAEELRRLEEKLLYPSGTQVAVFVSLAKGDPMRLDAVRLQIDGQLVAHYIYSAKELEALRKGGVQRLYVGNVATGEHQLEAVVDGVLANGTEYSRTERFVFRKEVKPKLVGLLVAPSDGGVAPITLEEW